MPRSRDQRCRRVLNAFFDEHLTNVYYVLEKLNVRGWKIARYVVTIPKEWTASSPRYDHDTRSLTWINNTKRQVLPQNERVNEIEQLFKTKMEPYEKSETVRLSKTRHEENEEGSQFPEHPYSPIRNK